MSTITYRAFLNADNSVSVTAGTAGSISTASVALLIDSTIADKVTLTNLFEALERRLGRESVKSNIVSAFDVTNTTTE